ncbi:MAG: hypothetical protein D6688_14205 [Alphaproteobacteria bacterium]|nr:MAG: hypothetical protein D6688_14205 [Alphaproteobacteria bacterium]
MRISDVDYGNGLPIDAYGPGYFRIGGQVHEGPRILHGGASMPWEGLADEGPLLALASKIDVLLIGTGAEMRFLAEGLDARLAAAGIGAEPMATPSACRTYNVLLSEGRRVAAALLPADWVAADAP